jgi:hypothetical protein
MLTYNQISVIIAASRDRVKDELPTPVYYSQRSDIRCADEAQDHIDQYYLDADRTVIGIPAPLDFN